MTGMTPEELEAQVKGAATFCAEVLELAQRLDIAPQLMVGLFGRMTKHLIDHRVERFNEPKAEATVKTMNHFMRGLGFKSEPIPDEGELH